MRLFFLIHRELVSLTMHMIFLLALAPHPEQPALPLVKEPSLLFLIIKFILWLLLLLLLLLLLISCRRFLP